MHRMHRIFRRRLACVPRHPQIRTRSLPESASPAAASRPDYPVHPVHRCSIYSPSRWICPVAGGGRPARRQTGVSQRGQAGFQRSRPPDTPHLTIGTPALPGGLPPMTGSHQRDKSVEGGPSVLVTETKPVSLSYDPPRRGGRGPDFPETTPWAGGGEPLHSQVGVVGFFTWMDRMNRIFWREVSPV